jgi:uncharacterized protein (DUF433 family)
MLMLSSPLGGHCLPAIRNQTASLLETPLYTACDAARYVRVPVWVPLASTTRGPFHPQFSRVHCEEAERISFGSLASLFVFSSLLRLPVYEPAFFEHMTRLLADRVVDDPRMITDLDWAVARLSPGVPPADREPIAKLVAVHQSRVESKDGRPVQIFPFSRDPASDAPRLIVIDPEIRFGRPTVKGVPTDVLAERWRAGDGMKELAEDYGLTAEEVDEAIRYEAPSRHPLDWPFAW